MRPCVPIIETICAHGDNFSPTNARRRPGAPRIVGIRWCDDSAMAHSDARRHTAPTPSDRHAILVAAAFGSSPGAHPLPAAHGPEQNWLRAVALGGQGRYAAARAELARVRGTGGVWSSFGASTEASLLRQLGGHRAAAVLDGRALAEAGSLRTSSGNTVAAWRDVGTVAARRDVDVVAAWCDAATGLAADALGRGRLAVCGSLLDRCAAALDAAESEAGRRPSCDSGSVSHGSGPNPLSRQATSPVRAAGRTAQWNSRTASDRSGTP